MVVEGLIHDLLISSVVPASFTGEQKVHEFTNIDLAMKLHYVKSVYFFNSDAASGLTIQVIKEPLFRLLELHHPVSGRIRRDENGRPLIKCNDSGVRIVEAKCSKTVDERLGLNDSSLLDMLVYDEVLGPDLGFSPLVYIQFTTFKCGGMSIGLNYAHVLGDAFSASDFIKMWGKMMAGHAHTPPMFLDAPKPRDHIFKSSLENSPPPPFALKKVCPVGDHWTIPNPSKLVTHVFQISPTKLNHLLFKVMGPIQEARVKPFEIISAIIWKSLAKMRRDDVKLKTVTVCTNENEDGGHTTVLLRNNQVISTVKTDSKVTETDTLELAKLISEKSVDERSGIEEILEKETKEDYIVYGSNLTFVNLEGANIYELEIKGLKPIFANYSLTGVGPEGAILVMPGTENDTEECGRGLTINVILPQDEIAGLRDELHKKCSIC